jgi:hypothetical protein
MSTTMLRLHVDRGLACETAESAQNRPLRPVMLTVGDEKHATLLDCYYLLPQRLNSSRPMGEISEGGFMEPVLIPSRNRFRRGLTIIAGLFGKLLAILAPQAQEVRLQRMCPFCGLITARAKTSCLECGKMLDAA